MAKNSETRTIPLDTAIAVVEQRIDTARRKHADVPPLADYDTRIEEWHRYEEGGLLRDDIVNALRNLAN